MTESNWFNVDRKGLRKLIESKSKLFVISELLSNAWDEAATKVSVTLEPASGRGRALLVVTDDSPEGFADLTHAYTLYAESGKKDAPEKRGRFNVGEKLVLALCDKAEIVTTTGNVRFNEDGSRTNGRDRTETGSVFTAVIRMTKAELDEITDTIGTLIPPPEITTTFNGKVLRERKPIASFEATLPTVRADSEGVLRGTMRKTTVDVYEPLAGEEAMIYELGIPVVTTGDRYHVDIRQKVPLTSDRDNVPPAYLRRVRAEVLNATATRLDAEAATAHWVSEALGEKTTTPDSIRAVIHARYGDNVVTANPRDPEANARAAAAGAVVLPGRTFSAPVWEKVREAQAAPPSTVAFASPMVLAGGPGDPVVDTVPPSEYTVGMRYTLGLAEALAVRLFGEITTKIVRSQEGFGACYGSRRMTFNLQRLGRSWFDPPTGWTHAHLAKVISLIVHEMAHERSHNHLSEEYYHALSDFAGQLVVITLDQPGLFRFPS